MDEVFFKSALPAHGPFLLDDSSLALPAGPAARAASRSLRVQQQVQLTLARRARRTTSSGSVHLQRSASKSFDATEGFTPGMAVNGMDFNSRSSSRIRRPSRRVEVSPPPSPEVSRSHFNHSSLRYGTYTHPGHRLLPPPDPSIGLSPFSGSAFSDGPRVPRLQTSATTLGRFPQRSLRYTPAHQAVFPSAEFQQSGGTGTSRSRNQALVRQDGVFVNTPTPGDTVLAAAQPDDDFAWLARVWREGARRQLSYPASPTGDSMEVDMGRLVEVDSPFQQTQAQDAPTLKSEDRSPEMTLERAVNLLTLDNEETVICAARHIQTQCFRSSDAKKIVYYLRGIEKLLQLLYSDSEEVQHMAAGALRNVVYQSSENKMEVKESNGLATILHALTSSRDVETRRELTGLLWNLSSHDLLKERLTREALPVLTKSVLVPSSGISEGENPKDELLADADIFHNATGCLR